MNSIISGIWNDLRYIICIIRRNLITIVKNEIALIFFNYLFILMHILTLLLSFVVIWSFRDHGTRLNHVLILDPFLIVVVLKRGFHADFVLVFIIMIRWHWQRIVFMFTFFISLTFPLLDICMINMCVSFDILSLMVFILGINIVILIYLIVITYRFCI